MFKFSSKWFSSVVCATLPIATLQAQVNYVVDSNSDSISQSTSTQVGSLRYCLSRLVQGLDADGSNQYSITFNSSLGTITLTNHLPIVGTIAGLAPTITIDGVSGNTISGNNLYQAFFVSPITTAGSVPLYNTDTIAVSISNLTLQNCASPGGTGGTAGGAGGGLGAGGAIFVDTNASVSVQNIAFTSCRATGGAGANGNGSGGGGGGGGYMGNGGSGGSNFAGGGGGGFRSVGGASNTSTAGGGGGGNWIPGLTVSTGGAGNSNTSGAAGGGGGVLTAGGAGGTSSGGSGGNGLNSSGGGAGGVGSGDSGQGGTSPGGGGGGAGSIVSGTGGSGGSGNFGGGGGGGGRSSNGLTGNGGAGGKFGGGGAPARSTSSTASAALATGVGGDFGGGAGGASNNGSGSATSGSNGGFGGGGGGVSSSSATGGIGGFGGGGGVRSAGGTEGGAGGSPSGTGGGGGGAGLGGAIFIRGSDSYGNPSGSLILNSGCTFSGNTVTAGAGGVGVFGGTSGTAGNAKGNILYAMGNLTSNIDLTFSTNDFATPSGTTFNKNGTGNITFTGVNNVGNITMNGGSLFVTGTGSIGASAIITLNGANSFDISGSSSNQTIQALNGISGSTVLLGTNTLTLNNAGSTSTFAGNIQGNGALIFTGSGTQTFTNSNSYSGGTTITGGTLNISADNALGSGALVFNGGALQFGSVFSLRSFTTTASSSALDTQGFAVTFSNTIANGGSPGGLTKLGSGTLTLSNTNTYTLGTTISAGTLEIFSESNIGGSTAGFTLAGGTLQASGNVTTSGATSVTSNSTLTTDSLVTTTLSGILTGSNSATLTLSGSGINSLSGIAVNNTDIFTIAGIIGGSQALTKSGTGNLVLTGTNTYTGGTTISAGTLTVSSGNNPLGNVTNNSVLIFNPAGASAYTGSISGSGSVTMSGSGTLTLSNTNNYTGGTTISAGILALGSGGTLLSTGALGLSGSGTFDISNSSSNVTIGDLSSSSSTSQIKLGNKNLIFGTSNNTSFLGSVVTTGGYLTKSGTGTVTFSTSGLSSANLHITQGAISIPSSTTVNVANYIQDSAATFSIGIITSSTGKLIVAAGGSATLSGALQIVPVPDNSYSGGTIYTILTAPNLSGTFSSLTFTSPLFSGGTITYPTVGGQKLVQVTLGPVVTTYTVNSSSDSIAVGSGTSGSLRYVLSQIIPSGFSNNITINFDSARTITLSDHLPIVSTPVTAATITINGAGSTINGINTYQGFFVTPIANNGNDTVTANINQLTLTNCACIGGAGGNGTWAGGGGMGAGGAIFVDTGANVVATNVTFTSCNATGGAGGQPTGGSANGSAGGGGYGGGGGGFGAASTFDVASGGGGGFRSHGGNFGQGSGGAGGGGARWIPGAGDNLCAGASPTNSAGGGGGGSLNSGAIGASDGSTGGNGGSGVFGAGGAGGSGTGANANGSFSVTGGGGGGASPGALGGSGAIGGFGAGGGGGGAWSLSLSNPNTYGNPGAGGKFGGGGGIPGTVAKKNTGVPGGDFGGGGGGGGPGEVLFLGGGGGFGGGGGGYGGTGGFGAGSGGATFSQATGSEGGQGGANSTNSPGGGGAGLGGAIFVRTGGSLTLNATCTFSGSTATGGARSSIAGSNGDFGSPGNGRGKIIYAMGPVTLNVPMTFGTNDFAVQPATPNSTFTQNGSGTITITGQNATYTNPLTGGTTSNLNYNVTMNGAGNLIVTGTGSLSSTCVVTLSTSATSPNTFDISGTTPATSQTLGGLAGGSSSVSSFTNLGAINLILNTQSSISSNFAGIIKGTGSVTIQGSGTQIFSGSNSYSGGTTLTSGTLSITNNNALGASSGVLTLNGGVLTPSTTLNCTQTSVVLGSATISPQAGAIATFTGLLSGNSLTASGSGTLVLSNSSNSYSGGTTLTNGALSISNGSALGTGGLTFFDTTNAILETTATLTYSGAIVVNSSQMILSTDANTTATLTGVISDANTGSLLKVGPGKLILSATNTYSGGSNLTNGLLAIRYAGGLGAYSGSGNGLIFNGGNLQIGTTSASTITYPSNIVINSSPTITQFDAGSTATLSGMITSSGSFGLTQAGPGTLILSNTTGISYTGATIVSAGTLQLVAGSLGTEGPIINNASVIFNQVGSGTFAGSITGTGSLTLIGGASLTLGGINSYAGGTTITSGTLIGTTTSLQGNILSATNAYTAVTFNQTTTGSYSGIISGGANVIVQGGGVITLSGTNTYTGTTTLTSSTLQGTALSLPSNIVNNGTLNFNQNVSGVYVGSISGSGSVVMNGMSTLTLAATNSYTGGTSIASGTLQGYAATSSATDPNTGLEVFSAAGSLQGAMSVSSGATLTFNQTSDSTFNSSITGSGTLVKTGPSVLTIGPLNSGDPVPTIDDSMSIIVNQGTFQVTADGGELGTGGTGNFNIQNNATVVFLQQSAGTYLGQITGSGQVTVQGGGTLTVLNPQAYANSTFINYGTTVNLNSNILFGPLTNNGTAVFQQSANGTFPFTITGPGVLNKTLSGSLMLTDSIAQNSTVIDEGAIGLLEMLTGNVTVNAAGTLTGVGPITGDVSSSGTVQPGTGLSLSHDPHGFRALGAQSVSSLVVTGNYAQLAGSTLAIEINPSTSTYLEVDSGVLTIQTGSTLDIIVDPGNYSFDKMYTIVYANGGFLDDTEFSSITTSSASILPLITYDFANPGNIQLQLQFTGFSSSATSSNNLIVANVLDQLQPTATGDLSDVIVDLSFLDASMLNQALLAMQPVLFKGMTLSQQNNEIWVERSITDQLSAKLACYKECQEESNSCQTKKNSLWVSIFGDLINQESETIDTNYQAGFRTKTCGTVIGFEREFSKGLSAGVMTAYTGSHVRWREAVGKGHINAAYGGAYATWLKNQFYLNLAFIGSYDWYSASRRIVFDNIDRTASHYHQGYQLSANLELGKSFDIGPKVTLKPFEMAQLLYQEECSFTETGAQSLDLNVQGVISKLLRNELGATLAYCAPFKGGSHITFDARLSWIAEVRYGGRDYTSEFVDTAIPFTLEGVRPNRSMIGTGAGIGLRLLEDRFSISFRYDGEFEKNYQNQKGTVSLKGRF